MERSHESTQHRPKVERDGFHDHASTQTKSTLLGSAQLTRLLRASRVRARMAGPPITSPEIYFT